MNGTETYNGYCNRETWALALHLSNDQGLYDMALDAAEDALRAEADWAPAQQAAPSVRVIGESLKSMAAALLAREYGWNDTLDMMREDVGSFWRIDWDEIGAEFIPSEHGR